VVVGLYVCLCLSVYQEKYRDENIAIRGAGHARTNESCRTYTL